MKLSNISVSTLGSDVYGTIHLEIDKGTLVVPLTKDDVNAMCRMAIPAIMRFMRSTSALTEKEIIDTFTYDNIPF